MKTRSLLRSLSPICIASSALLAVSGFASASPSAQTSFQLAQADVAGHAETALSSAEKWLGKNLRLTWQATKSEGHTIEEKVETLLCDARQMVWRAFDEDRSGQTNSTTYTIQRISPTVTQISWREDPQKSNLAWVWTLDESTGKAYGVVVNSQPHENLPLKGEFTVVETLTPEETSDFQCPQ